MNYIVVIVLSILISGCGLVNTFRVYSPDQVEKDIREVQIIGEIYSQICENKKQSYEYLIGASKQELINTLGKPNRKINARFSIFYMWDHDIDELWIYHTKDDYFKYWVKFGLKSDQVVKIYMRCTVGSSYVAEI